MPTFNTSNPLPMSDQAPASYPPAACWCRNCDHAAKAGLSPLAALQLGSRFIVCPDCGNKRCPKGTNHELACANSNAPGQIGSEWENVKPAASTPAPALLSLSQLDALAHALEEERQGCAAEPASPLGYWPTAVAALLGHVEVLSAQRHALAMQLTPGSATERAPTVWAYVQACTALESHRSRADEADAQVADMARNIAGASRLVDAANATVAEATRTVAEVSGQLAEADAQVAMLKAELGEQEVAKMRIVAENIKLRGDLNNAYHG